MPLELTALETDLLLEILENAKDQMSYASCNDYGIPDTIESRNLVKKVIVENGDHQTLEDAEKDMYFTKEGNIVTTDFLICGYLIRKIKAA